MRGSCRSLFARVPAVLPAFFFAACVSIEYIPGPGTASVSPSYPGVGNFAFSNETVHFQVEARSREAAEKYSALCEFYYLNVMNDTGLYSFMPSNPYNVVVYAGAAEYVRKTSQPEWSGGITLGNAILTYEGAESKGTLAHEITHLIFNEFMGAENAGPLRWINEGLAVREECRASENSRLYYREKIRGLVRPNPFAFSQLASMTPLGEEGETVEKWYAQVYSVVDFMITEGGSLGFAIFLRSLREGKTADEAVFEAFSGKWRGLKEIEEQWQRQIAAN